MHKIIYICLLLIITDTVFAQKKPLDHSVYDGWQHIGERMISNDGKWIVFTIDPQEGDNELLLQSADKKYSKSIPRGYNAVITEDSRFVIFKIKAFYKDIREARIKKKKPEEMAKQRDFFLQGAKNKNIPEAVSKDVFDQMETFARYSAKFTNFLCVYFSRYEGY